MTRVMQFLKNNYEKVLLGVVLFGLVVAVVLLPFRISSEKAALENLRTSKLGFRVEPIPPLDTNRYEAALAAVATPMQLDLSTTNKLLNPVRWVRGPNGQPVKLPVGEELKPLEITKITPLYLIINLNSVMNISDMGARYVIGVENQAAPLARRRHVYYLSLGEKKDTLKLLQVKGPPANPTAVVLRLSNTGQQITISKDQPFRHVDGYMADLRFPPERNKTFLRCRVGDAIFVAGEEYIIVAISENEVVLSARSNGKKYTIRYNAAP